MDKGAWRATVYEVTQLKRQNIHTYVSLFFLANISSWIITYTPLIYMILTEHR